MRKSLWVTMLLVVVSISLAVTGFVRLDQTGEEIEIEETVLFGDKAALDGLAVDYHLYDPINGGYLYWDTTYRPNADELPVTMFTYQEEQRSMGERETKALSVGGVSGQQTGSSGAIDLMEMGGEDWGPLLVDVADRTKAGESNTEVVRLSDYCEYFPLHLNVSIGALHYSYSGLAADDEENEMLKKLEDCFRILTPKECKLKVEITKRVNGTVSDFGLEILSGVPNIVIDSVVTEECCYLVLSGTMADGSPLDTSHMVGDCGIYRLPYETKTVEGKYADRQETVLHVDQMEQLVSFNAGSSIEDLYFDEETHRMEIISVLERADGSSKAMLTVYDLEKRVQVQQLVFAEKETLLWISDVYQRDDFIVAVLETTGFILLTRDEEGLYEKKIEADFPEPTDDYDTTWSYSWNDYTVDYDGSRLVFGAPMSTVYRRGNTCAFRLAVYEAGELVYYGNYASSLGIGGGQYSDSCNAWGNTPVEVRWE